MWLGIILSSIGIIPVVVFLLVALHAWFNYLKNPVGKDADTGEKRCALCCKQEEPQ